MSGIGRAAAEPGGDGAGAQQAGTPDRAVPRDPKARVPAAAAKRRQGVPEPSGPSERDRALNLHLRTPYSDGPVN